MMIRPYFLYASHGQLGQGKQPWKGIRGDHTGTVHTITAALRILCIEFGGQFAVVSGECGL